MSYPKKVTEIIKNAVPWTIALQLPAILLAWIVGNVLGALAAYRRGIFDKVFFPLALGANSIPFFAFGMLLVYLFGIYWHVFPAVGGYDSGLIPTFSWGFFASVLYHYTLPFLSIFLIFTGGQAIGMRSMCIYELEPIMSSTPNGWGYRRVKCFSTCSAMPCCRSSRAWRYRWGDDRGSAYYRNDFFVSGYRHGRAFGHTE